MKKEKDNNKQAKISKEQEAQRFYRDIGLETEEDRNRFKGYGFDQEVPANYEIRFTNNTELKNG